MCSMGKPYKSERTGIHMHKCMDAHTHTHLLLLNICGDFEVLVCKAAFSVAKTAKLITNLNEILKIS